MVLWIGISGSIFSIENLFFDGASFSRIYEYLAAVSFIFVNGTFILNYYNYSLEETIPKDEKSDFTFLPSKARKIFGNYIFLPLTILYFLILFAYVIKIAITGIWPKEIVVYMGTGYFVFAILCYYFIYPEESSFFDKLKNSILISFFFVGGLMSYAIGVRINQYGLTMRRGIIVLIAICILLYPLLGLLFKNHRLSLLMYTIVWVFGIGIFGPVNIDQLALSSQLSRLNHLLAEENIQTPLGSWALLSLAGENTDKFRYIASTYGSKGMNHLLELKNICENNDVESYWVESYWCATNVIYYLWINTENIKTGTIDWEDRESTEYFRFYADNSLFATGLDIKGYNKIYSITTYDTDTQGNEKWTGINPAEIEQKYVDELAKISKEKKEYYESDINPYEIMLGEKRFIITEASGEREIIYKRKGDDVTSARKLTRARGYLLIK